MTHISPAAPDARKARPFRLARLPAKSRFVVTPMILSFLMSGVVASIATIRALGLAPDLATSILKAWAMSYVVAFPSALVVMPIVRWIVDRLVEAPGERTGCPPSIPLGCQMSRIDDPAVGAGEA